MREADSPETQAAPTTACSAYFSSLRVLVAVLPAVICIVTGALAWYLNPGSGGFAVVPEHMRVQTTESSAVTRTLTQTADGGTTLQLFEPFRSYPAAPDDTTIGYEGSGTTAAVGPIIWQSTRHGRHQAIPVPNSRWHHMVLDPAKGWAPCSTHVGYLQGTIRFLDADTPVILAPAVPAHPLVSSNAPATAYRDGVCLHWGADGPIGVNGPYLSAGFPSMLGIDTTSDGQYTFSLPVPQVGDIGGLSITRTLTLSDGDTADWGVQSDPHPTSTTGSAPASWTWVTTPSPQNILLAAINTTDLQHENNDAFVSGVPFGLAGGSSPSSPNWPCRTTNGRWKSRKVRPGPLGRAGAHQGARDAPAGYFSSNSLVRATALAKPSMTSASALALLRHFQRTSADPHAMSRAPAMLQFPSVSNKPSTLASFSSADRVSND